MISIAMTTYNGEMYLREQLDSILTQTRTDFEIVVCDDCSRDSTPKILAEYAIKDSRFRIYENEKNLGYRKNFNKAVSLCKGDFIAFSDQDDVWLPHHLDTLINHIGENFVCGGATIRCLENGDLLNVLSPTKHQAKTLNSQVNRLVYQCYAFNLYQGASQMISRKAAELYFPIEKDAFAHDWALATNAIAENKFVYVNEVITKWRKHPSQVTNKRDSRKTRKERLATFVLLLLKNKKRIAKAPVIVAVLEKAAEFHTNTSILYRLKNLSHSWRISKIIYARDTFSTLKTVVGYFFTASL